MGVFTPGLKQGEVKIKARENKGLVSLKVSLKASNEGEWKKQLFFKAIRRALKGPVKIESDR